jgi:hypothetical protein
MKRYNHTITRPEILTASLVSLTGHIWYDNTGSLIPWFSGSVNLSAPDTGSIVYNTNVTGSLIEGYYEYNGNSWDVINGVPYKDNRIVVQLDASAYEMGQMYEFDGVVEHNTIGVNFMYEVSCTETGSTITVFNTTTTDLVKIVQAIGPEVNVSQTAATRLDTQASENIKTEDPPTGIYIVIDDPQTTNTTPFTVIWSDGATHDIGLDGGITRTFATTDEQNITIRFTSPYMTTQTVKYVNCSQTFLRIATENLQDIKDEDNNYFNPE